MSASTAAAAAPPPLALYLHFPWCVRKCPYCDFNSHAVRGELPEQAYVAALLADLDWELRMHPARELVSVYCGGGTPSLFSADAFAELFAGIRARLPLAADVEITVEVNPGTLRAGYFEQLRGLGCNRLSIGVQSFDDGRLRALGRVHDAAAARATVAAARAAGFDDFNLDLMFGLPGQSPAAALDDVRAALALAPTHLSHYQLTIEPGTVFAARPPRLPAEPAILRAQRACHELLAEHGFAHYEVSAHARRGRESRHNLNYWQFGDYLGIGAGAHAKRSAGGGIERSWRVTSPREYLRAAGSPAALRGRQRLTPREGALEFLLNALRLRAGFPPSLFEQRTGLPWSSQQPAVARARALGLLDVGGGRVRASERGWALLDSLLLEFVPEEGAAPAGAAAGA